METRKILQGIQAGVEAVKAYRQQKAAPPASETRLRTGSEAGPEAGSELAVEAEPEAQTDIRPRASAAAAPQLLPPLLIRTSEKDWLARLTKAYREHAHVELIDDAGIGIDPATQSLLQMGLTGKLTRKEWTAVAISGGMTIFGASLVVLAILDPDPTSKLGLLVASGALLALTGGFQTIRLLTHHKPPSITISGRGIHIDWE